MMYDQLKRKTIDLHVYGSDDVEDKVSPRNRYVRAAPSLAPGTRHAATSLAPGTSHAATHH